MLTDLNSNAQLPANASEYICLCLQVPVTPEPFITHIVPDVRIDYSSLGLTAAISAANSQLSGGRA